MVLERDSVLVCLRREITMETSPANSTGIVYSVFGEPHTLEAIRARKQCNRVWPNAPAVLFTDLPALVPSGLFMDVQALQVTSSKALKIAAMLESPFDRTLFLDSDTWLCEPIPELFELLGRFDLLAAHAPVRMSMEQSGIPASFPEYNAGVICFNRTDRVIAMLERWLELFDRHGDLCSGKDQPWLRQALYESKVAIGTLPPEYNLRVCYPVTVGGRATAKVIHAHLDDREVSRLTTNPRLRAQRPAPWSLGPVISRRRVVWLAGFVRDYLRVR